MAGDDGKSRTDTRAAGAPTTDRLRRDIDSGVTGEKVAYPDPAAAPLGADAEAGGFPPGPHERMAEAHMRPAVSDASHARRDTASWPYWLAAVAVGVMIVAGIAAFA